MRLNDALLLPLEALWQQKLRTMLTTLGVVFGAFVLAASLSIGQGVQETIDREARKNEISRTVNVFARWNVEPTKADEAEVKVDGKMNDGRRDRIRKALAERVQPDKLKRTWMSLNRERLRQLEGIPHVERVIPSIYENGFALLGSRSEAAVIAAARPDNEAARKRIVAGRYLETADEPGVVLSEVLAYRLGLVDDGELASAIGKPVRLELRKQATPQGFSVYLNQPRADVSLEASRAIEKIQARLPKLLGKLDLTASEILALAKLLPAATTAEPEVSARDFPLVGVIREATEEEQNRRYDPFTGDSFALLPYRTATDFSFQRQTQDDQPSFSNATILVDQEKEVKAVLKRTIELGLDGRAAIEFIERERLIYLLIFGGMTCVAGVALLVSALGIANTMFMSVLERTREIGVMKAVGADNGHLQLMFLIEGGVIGLMGAGLGTLLAWSASFPGDAWVRSMVTRDLKIDLKSSIFVFPPWIILSVVGFTVLVTTLAALYPARHASRIDPVKALRHE